MSMLFKCPPCNALLKKIENQQKKMFKNLNLYLIFEFSRQIIL